MSTYEIFPNTIVDGGMIDIDATNAVFSACRRFCDDTPDCKAYTWDHINEKCALYSQLETFKPFKGYDTYVKKGAPSYWPLWFLIVGMLIILFINKCRK